MKPYHRWIIPVLVIALVAVAVPKLLWIADQVRYAHLRQTASDLLYSLHDRPPLDCPRETWAIAVDWIGTACGNVCFSPSHVSHEELTRFTSELQSRLKGRVDIKTLDWIWLRLAATGRHGQQYVERFQPIYRQWIGQLVATAGEAQSLEFGIHGSVPLLTNRDQLDRHLDQLVAIRGTLSETKIPKIIGVAVSNHSHDLRGKEAYAVGILRKWTVTQADIDKRTAKYGPMPHDGPGDKYRLYFDLAGKIAEARPWPPHAPD